MKTLKICIYILIILSFCPQASAAGNDDLVKMRIVYSIIGEAEGEPYQGKLAIACAIINRTSKFGSLDKALKGVYGERSPRVLQRKYSSKVLVDAIRAYEESLNVGVCDFVDGATHWEGTAFKTPYWAKDMILVTTIANQRFYKERK
jgi:hypothetical protein